MPIGSIIAWPVDTLPNRPGIWLECNGQSCAAYPKLVAILGKDTVPDYRGVFLRGYGSQSHTKLNGSLNGSTETIHSSANLGELQGDAIRNIIGEVDPFLNIYDQASTNHQTYGALFFSNFRHASSQITGGTSFDWLTELCIDASRIIPIANENRPINIAVKYLIKAK